MELDTVVKVVAAFYRLVGTDSGDQSLIEQGETIDDVVYLNLTQGCRKAQRWMIQNGSGDWRKRTSSVLTFTGTDALDGGRKVTLPSDFLRAYGNFRRSALVQANGDRWGTEIVEYDDNMKGDLYYIRGRELWVTRIANLPTSGVFLDYHYIHPLWEANLDDADIDFPMEARHLIVAYAAESAMDDNWLPGGVELEGKINRAVKKRESEARQIARPTKQPRRFKKPWRFGNRW